MYCKKCGSELKPDAKFCSKCGSPVSLPLAEETVKINREEVQLSEISEIQDNNVSAPKKRKKPIALIVILLLVVCVTAGGVVYLNSDTYHFKKNMKTANALYEEGNYREALEAYEAALAIDRESEEAIAGKIAAHMGLGEQLYREEDYKGAVDSYKAVLTLREDYTDAYLRMSNAYIKLEKFERAVTTLQDGYQVTKDMALKTREEYLMDNIVLVRVDILYSDQEEGEWQQVFERVNKYIYYYDDSGQLSREETYTPRASLITNFYTPDEKVYDDDVMTVNATVYSDGGRIVKKITESYSGDECVSSSTYVSFYDSNGTAFYTFSYDQDAKISYKDERPVSVQYADTDKSNKTFTYDDQERLINVDSGSNRRTFGYDDQGKILSDLGTTDSNTYNYIYSYDDRGRLIYETRYNNGEPEWETVYDYDDSGNLILQEFTESWYNEVHEWVYDSNGKLIEDNLQAYRNDHEITYSYDMEGNLHKEKYVDSGKESEMTYTYDTFGNTVYEEEITFDMYTQESTTWYMKYTNTYAFIGDLEDSIDIQDAEASEDGDEMTEAEETGSEGTAAGNETDPSEDEVSDFAEEEEPESEKTMLDIVVEDEVKQIREWFYGTQNNIDSYEQSTSDNVTFYLEDGIPVKIVVKKGTDGWDYAREYYFHDGVFYFAFIYNGGDEHRLYFKEEQMIRYIDQNKNTYDYGQTDQFSDWETPALQEAYRLLETGRN